MPQDRRAASPRGEAKAPRRPRTLFGSRPERSRRCDGRADAGAGSPDPDGHRGCRGSRARGAIAPRSLPPRSQSRRRRPRPPARIVAATRSPHGSRPTVPEGTAPSLGAIAAAAPTATARTRRRARRASRHRPLDRNRAAGSRPTDRLRSDVPEWPRRARGAPRCHLQQRRPVAIGILPQDSCRHRRRRRRGRIDVARRRDAGRLGRLGAADRVALDRKQQPDRERGEDPPRAAA